jgi:UDP-glucose 4-epimerase
VLERLRELGASDIEFHRADVRDAAELDRIFGARRIDAVIHFAALKAVGESVEKPQLYYDNNIGGTKTLIGAMSRHGVKRMVFSSSCTVYGEPEKLPVAEDHPLRAQNPYGETKLACEQLLAKKVAAEPDFLCASLRYFNPIGAHASGRIGEDPRGIPTNLMPFISQVAVGRRTKLRVWGNDYPTPDGTCIRDYIHVMDLAEGHVAALRYLDRGKSLTVNLGTGRGHSVLETVKAFERATGKSIPFEIHPRRPGDAVAVYADASLAAKELGWKTRLDIEDMCRDSWRWQSQNPDGYPDK